MSLGNTPTTKTGQPIGWPVSTSLPRPAPERITLTGRFGRLEPLSPAHADDLWAAFAQDPSGFTYLPIEDFDDAAGCAAFVAHSAESEDPLFYAICDPEGRALGHASFLRITPAHGVIEVGYIHFSKALQRTPLATEAMFLMMSYVFETLGYRRYEWKCDALNGPSRRAAARLGFEFEGLFRQAMVYKGRNRDTAWFSILDSEWPMLREGFKRWLEPANFDANGQQKRPLSLRPVVRSP